MKVGTGGKKFKMKVKNCSDANCVGNDDSDESDDQPKTASKLKVKTSAVVANHIAT